MKSLNMLPWHSTSVTGTDRISQTKIYSESGIRMYLMPMIRCTSRILERGDSLTIREENKKIQHETNGHRKRN